MSGDSPEAQELRQTLQDKRLEEIDARHKTDVLDAVLGSIKNIPHRPEDLDKAVEKSIEMHWAKDALTVKDVMEHLGTLTPNEYAAITTPDFTEEEMLRFEEGEAKEAAYQKQMSQWDSLTDELGGADAFWSDDLKVQAMRRVDHEGDMPWDEFQAAVIAEVERVSQMSIEERQDLWEEDRDAFIERQEAKFTRFPDLGDDIEGFDKDEYIADSVASWEKGNPKPQEQVLENDLSM